MLILLCAPTSALRARKMAPAASLFMSELWTRITGQPMPAATRPGSLSFLKLAGPGLVVAATGIGSGDVVAATVGGARYGVVLLWAILAGAFFKFVLSEGIARWQLATGTTALE